MKRIVTVPARGTHNSSLPLWSSWRYLSRLQMRSMAGATLRTAWRPAIGDCIAYRMSSKRRPTVVSRSDRDVMRIARERS